MPVKCRCEGTYLLCTRGRGGAAGDARGPAIGSFSRNGTTWMWPSRRVRTPRAGAPPSTGPRSGRGATTHWAGPVAGEGLRGADGQRLLRVTRPPVWSSAGRAARPGTDRFAGRPPTAGRTAAGCCSRCTARAGERTHWRSSTTESGSWTPNSARAPSPELTALRTATRAQAQEPFLPGERRTVHGAEAPRPSRQPVRGRARHRMRSPAGSTTDQAG